MDPEVKQPDDAALWEQVQKDRSSTVAEEVIVPEKLATDPADPLAGLPEPTRKLIEGLQSTVTDFDGRFKKVNQQLATAHGTIGNLKQKLDESQVNLQKIGPVIETVEADKKAAEKATADALAQKRKALREKLADFPDVIEYLDAVLPADAEPAKEVKAEPKPEPKPEPTEVESFDPEERKVLILQRELSDRVPGWMKTRDTAEFKAWLPAQAEDIKAKSNSWDVDEAASVFEAYEKHKSDAAEVARVAKERDERLRRGESPQGRGSSTGNVDPSPDALWNKVSRDRAKARAA